VVLNWKSNAQTWFGRSARSRSAGAVQLLSRCRLRLRAGTRSPYSRHRDFCEVAMWEAGEVSGAPRVASRTEQLLECALQLRSTDRVAMEATGSALAIARIIGAHVAAVEIVNTRRLKATTPFKEPLILIRRLQKAGTRPTGPNSRGHARRR